MSLAYFLLPLIYSGLSISCFYFGWKSYAKKEIFFKKGIKGTTLENSEILLRVQICSLFLLGTVSLVYGLFALTM